MVCIGCFAIGAYQEGKALDRLEAVSNNEAGLLIPCISDQAAKMDVFSYSYSYVDAET